MQMQRIKSYLFVVVALSALVLLLAGVFLVAPAAITPAAVQAQPNAQVAAASPRTITVVGEGTINIEPDVARANIGVEVVKPSVKEASSEAKAVMDNVLQVLTAQGIAEKDIQTSGFNIWVERPYGPDGLPADEALYHVSNQVSVTIRDLDKVGSLLDATIEAGANNIYGVSFSVDDPNQLGAEAREKAVADAEAKAEELAKLSGVQLGEVVSVSEVIGSGGLFPGSLREAAAIGLGGGGGGPISPGELELTLQLQVVYAIQ